ncbi:MAG: lysophospholipid acyltransferase family protein [Endozoicomonas sp.]
MNNTVTTIRNNTSRNMKGNFKDNYAAPSRFKEGLGRLVLRLMGGWTLQGQLPDIGKYVMIVAHHTSNWDFVVGIAAKLILRIKIRFFAKHSLFFWPLGVLMRGLGGVPIERSKSINRVEQAAKEIRESDSFVLAITPEGTRSRVERWKSGFYHIARSAEVPIVTVAFDFANRRIVFGEPMTMTGDQEHDFREMHRFFLPYKPRYPELGCNGPFEKEQ